MTEENLMETKRCLKGYVSRYHLETILSYLKDAKDEKLLLIKTIKLRSPIICFFLSFFFGLLGVDRFAVGDGGLGVLKFLTGGGFFVWAFVDLFLIAGKAKEKNYNDIVKIIS